ncbi:MAG: ribonuclease III [Phycisphaerales bacterium]|nr:MAG: ribonuclease III [Phycisphaerales bacterium]
MKPEQVETANRLTGHEFQDLDLLRLALTHASLADSRLESNERLEFLGDAVLGMVVCRYLYDNYVDLEEGEMTKIKSTVVSRRNCSNVARELGLDELLRLGKGMSNTISLPHSVLAAVYESLVGALLIDGGLEAAQRFILGALKPHIEEAYRSGHHSNFKSVLQQVGQQKLGQSPQYVVLDEKGPDHAKCFEVCVALGSRRFESSWGASKKQAEQQAALNALAALGFAEVSDDGNVHIKELNGP